MAFKRCIYISFGFWIKIFDLNSWNLFAHC